MMRSLQSLSVKQGEQSISHEFFPTHHRLSDKYDMRSFLILTSLIQVGGSVVYALAQ